MVFLQRIGIKREINIKKYKWFNDPTKMTRPI